MNFIKKKKFWVGLGNSIAIVSVLVIFGFLSDYIKPNEDKNQQKKVKHESAKKSQTYLGGKYADLDAVLSVIRGSYALFEKTNHEYKKSIEGLEEILTFENVSNQKCLSRSKEKIKKALERLNDNEKGYNEIYIQMESEIKLANMTDEDKAEFLEGFEKGSAKWRKLMTENFEIARSGLLTFDAILDLFWKAHGSGKPDNQLIFLNELDTERLDELIKRLEEISLEENKNLQKLKEIEVPSTFSTIFS